MMSAEGGTRNAESALVAALRSIRERIASACNRAGRSVSEVTLVAVSKTVSAAHVRAAIAAGVTVLGENRVQEAEAKITELADLRSQVEWHLIGHLQSNKARKAASLFDVVQTIADENLASRLHRIAAELGRRLPVFIEVNLAGEVSKSGVAPHEALPLIETVSKFAALELRGVMAVPPYLENPADVRPYFRQLRALRDDAVRSGIADHSFTQLSMGMSHDFEIAIEEGATLVRIGTALFGTRM
ncbi:MAG TPA: YggS family pyridoxal phosphate-dependent enzyme [Blastocatellia bacterium]|nr:YggS family pyridoxal phosphate-dependent enzyme [Blastocatellia bacterium]